MAGSTTPFEIPGLPDFWQRVCSASHALLLLDYDGTLAPFHPDRMQARPLAGVLPAIAALTGLDGTTLALVSGRPVHEIQQLTGLDNVIIAGTHGFEIYRPGSGISQELPDSTTASNLDAIEQVARGLVGAELAERKIATVALHTRKLDTAAASDAQAAFRARIGPYVGPELEVRDFNGGVEVRVRSRDKGVALRELLDELPAADLVVYIGDDDTDEDAFRALPDHGFGIKVGSPESPTAAAGRLDDCDGVLRFLTNWIATETCQ